MIALPANGNVNAIGNASLVAELESLAQGAPSSLLSDEKLRKRLLEAAKAVIPAIEDKDDAAQRIFYTPLELAAAQIGYNINLFEKLVKNGTPMTTKELAQPIEADPAILERILKYMASLHLIKEVHISTWGPSRTSEFFVDRAYKAGIFHNHYNLALPWHALPAWLERTKYQQSHDIRDAAFGEGHGAHQGIFEWFAEHPKHADEFNLWMTAQRFGDSFWLDVLPFESLVLRDATPGKPVFVDIGGGIGHQCKALRDKFPDLPGAIVLQDQATVIANALAVNGMEAIEVDFFKEQPVKGARAYYMRNVLHDWHDDNCRKILAHIKDAMGPKSVLLIDEMVVPTKGAHKIGMQVDMSMLTACVSEERSEARWKELLYSAGFKIDNIYTYQSEVADSVIVATPM